MYVKCNCMWSYCLVFIRFLKERRGEDLLWYCNITPKPQTHHFHSISIPFSICYVVKSHLSNKTLQTLAQINIYSTKLLIHKPGKCSCFTQVYHRVLQRVIQFCMNIHRRIHELFIIYRTKSWVHDCFQTWWTPSCVSCEMAYFSCLYSSFYIPL